MKWQPFLIHCFYMVAKLCIVCLVWSWFPALLMQEIAKYSEMDFQKFRNSQKLPQPSPKWYHQLFKFAVVFIIYIFSIILSCFKMVMHNFIFLFFFVVGRSGTETVCGFSILSKAVQLLKCCTATVFQVYKYINKPHVFRYTFVLSHKNRIKVRHEGFD